MKNFNTLMLLAVLAIAVAGCGPVAAPETGANPAAPVEEVAEAANSFPVIIENCGLEITVNAPPERAVTMNQPATEMMLALGLEDKLVGTAYIDDEILPEWQEAYNQIPVLAEEYPSQEVLFSSEPDFVYGSFGSAFGDDAAGPREELIKLGITPYLSPSHCEDNSLRPKVAGMNDVYGEIMDIGRIFGIEEWATALVEDMQARLDQVQEKTANLEQPARVFWFDSGDDEPFVGAGTGVPNMIMELAGAENVFADVPGAWETVSWEEVIDRNADAVVIIEADWSTADEKIELLKTNEAYSSMQAVQNERFVIIPFSYTSAGVRNAAAVEIVAKGLYPDLFK